MDFQWDPIKDQANVEKHGISFEEATALFADSNHLVLTAKSVEDEVRLAIIGMIYGKLWTCIATERDGGLRLISCRRSREKEALIYEQEKKDS